MSRLSSCSKSILRVQKSRFHPVQRQSPAKLFYEDTLNLDYTKLLAAAKSQTQFKYLQDWLPEPKYQDAAEAKNFLRNKRREHEELRALFQERPKELARFADAADRQWTQIAWGWLCYLIFGIPLVTLAMNYLFNITMNLPVEAPMVGNMQFLSDPRRNQLRQRYEVENLEKIKINFTQVTSQCQLIDSEERLKTIFTYINIIRMWQHQRKSRLVVCSWKKSSSKELLFCRNSFTTKKTATFWSWRLGSGFCTTSNQRGKCRARSRPWSDSEFAQM